MTTSGLAPSLPRFTRLEKLDVSHNQLTPIANMERLNNLRGVWFSQNKGVVFSSEALSRFPNLECVNGRVIPLSQRAEKGRPEASAGAKVAPQAKMKKETASSSASE